MQRRTRERRGEAGFTLIELLVVIVILGVLSAVVVFAVRGSSDKGKGAAVATDERTLRTAQEAYCARAGRYASEMGQLTGDLPVSAEDTSRYKLLSEPSQYHDLKSPAPSGPCTGTGYEITCRDGTQMPDCGVPSTTPTSTPPTSTPPTSTPDTIPEPLPVGSWILAGDLPSSSSSGHLIGTASGKVVLLDYDRAVGGGSTSLYDAGTRSWTPTTPVPAGLTGAVAVPGAPTLACPNCGKILLHVGALVSASEWALYDADASPPTVTPVPPNRHECRLATSLTALADGTILAAGCSASTGAVKTRAEVYDPKAVVDPWKPLPDMLFEHTNAVAVRLKDGRVLVAAGGSDSKKAEIYDPAPTGSINIWTAAGETSDPAHDDDSSLTLLPDGRVLLINEGRAQLFTSDTLWGGASLCACRSGNSATMLGTGQVLVAGGSSFQNDDDLYVKTATLLNQTSIPAAEMPHGRFSQGGLLLQGSTCARDCGKVLLAGGEVQVIFDNDGAIVEDFRMKTLLFEPPII